MATPTLRPANRSDTYGTATTSRPGISSPWAARSSSRMPRLGARPSSAVGTTSSAAEAIMTRARPTRSDSGPCTQPPKATPSTTTVMDRPAAAGDTSRPCSISGRIACVAYMFANIADAPRNRAIAGRTRSASARTPGHVRRARQHAQRHLAAQ